MFGFRIELFDPAHIAFERTRDRERELFRGLGQAEERLQALSKLGPAWSIFKGDEWVTSGGVVPVMPHVGELWQIPSNNVAAFRVSYAKFFRVFVENILTNLPYERLQTTSPIDETHDRWMRFIGFEREGIARGYGINREDMAFWARLRHGR